MNLRVLSLVWLVPPLLAQQPAAVPAPSSSSMATSTATPALVAANMQANAEPAAAFAQALADYRAGRFEPAHATFTQLLAAAGDAAAPELRWNAALAALRVQRSGDAETAIQPLLQQADASWRSEAEFVLAMVAHQRAERAVAAAQLPDAEPLAWTMALRAMQQAIEGFARADQLRGRWPAAARNAERCSNRRREIERMQAAAKKPDSQRTEAPEPQPEPPRPQDVRPEEVTPDLAKDTLSAAEVAQLLQRLRQQERDKRALRQQAGAATGAAGERFW